MVKEPIILPVLIISYIIHKTHVKDICFLFYDQFNICLYLLANVHLCACLSEFPLPYASL